jgi:hypothetical protein
LISKGNSETFAKYGCQFVPAVGQHKVGVSLSTLERKPINGLRHPLAHETTGWYIWGGENFSDAPDFFESLCVDHLLERFPLVSDLLGLPPGYRFCMADAYLDVWYDKTLLKI